MARSDSSVGGDDVESRMAEECGESTRNAVDVELSLSAESVRKKPRID